ncbi:oxidoreductase HTATIP2-like [Corticium candelabrum]|uniref:oxidoreductase HTATIP2-like n=1 Tax=Corticium candelabrum TaxID=121492 RepID=UPI002E269F0E|nr:oxidoreductase HTATIP2-like [Corticium candelabrum]
MASARGVRAVIVGGTGECGRHILGEIVCSPVYTEVLSLGRRTTTIPEHFKATESDLKKLKQEIVDFDLEKFTVENWKSYFEGKDVLFVALGTILAEARRQPGRTIDTLRLVDFHLVARSAEIAKAAGVRHVSMLSVDGANSSSWFNYLKVKGEAEDAVEALGFERTSIWRITVVYKSQNSSIVEKISRFFFKSVRVEDLGKALREESEQYALRKDDFLPISRYSMRDIFEFARQAKEAEAKKGDNGATFEGDEAGQQPGCDRSNKESDSLGDGTTNEKYDKEED